MSEAFKPNLKFLRKVADGKVYPWSTYSQRMGRIDKFKGGRVTAEKHREAGLITISYGGVMWEGKCKLTEAGRKLLSCGETAP